MARIRHLAIVSENRASDVENRPFQAETRVHDPDGNGVDVSLRGWPVE